jgi:hypothetical protein
MANSLTVSGRISSTIVRDNKSHMLPHTFDPELSFANYRAVKRSYLSPEKQYRTMAEEYHKVLLRMRVGECQIGDIGFLKDTPPPGDEARGRFDELTLLPTNAGFDDANKTIMRTLLPCAPEQVFVAQDRRGSAGEDVGTETQHLGLRARHELRLRVGARVRLTRGLCGLRPGADATVVRLLSVGIEVETAVSQGACPVKVIVQRVDHILRNGSGQELAIRSQLPLALCYAVTFASLIGRTLDMPVFIDFRSGEWTAAGLNYIALSGLESLSSVRIVRLTLEHIRVDSIANLHWMKLGQSSRGGKGCDPVGSAPPFTF